MTSVQAEFGSARTFTELNTVLSYALDAHQCGCSVIPLKGGRNQVMGKQPRIPWLVHQKQSASTEQIDEWFRGGTSAYGIVCGQVSHLIVIDFDEPEAQATFIQKFPHLMDTYIVKSGGRGTLHLYFEVDFPVRTSKIRGGDQCQQILCATDITPDNIHQIPPKTLAQRAGITIQYCFLQDSTGKRYPPVPEIARRLLRQGIPVQWMRRGWNVYWIGDNTTELHIIFVSEIDHMFE